METVKIRTKKGRIITLSILEKSNTHLYGNDRDGFVTIVALKDIDSMLPIKK